MNKYQKARGFDQLEILGSAQNLERTLPGHADRQGGTHGQVRVI